MCESCVKEEFPDRTGLMPLAIKQACKCAGNAGISHNFVQSWEEKDSLCVESGSYMINFVRCSDCESQDMKIVNKNCTETNDEERITYQHACGHCDHIIAEHEHIFRVDNEYQHYEMSCLLCGSADDQRSIMPVDPRGPIM